MMTLQVLAVLLFCLLVSWASVALIRPLATRFGIGSLPSPRKIHTGFKPVLGGLGIALAVWLSALLCSLWDGMAENLFLRYPWFWAGYAAIVLIGLLDDLAGLNSLQKFGGQFISAALAVAGGTVVEAFVGPYGNTLSLGWFAIPFTLLWFVYIINALNLLDGLDGLAGGVALISLIGFATVAYLSMNSALFLLALLIIFALVGFLKHNWHPASIFMGDVGSLQLGYLLAFFSVEGLKIAGSNQVYFLVSLVLLGVPLTDTLTSFLRRLARGEDPFKPDREHIHHRLLKLGLTHSQTVILLYLFAFFYTLCGILMFYYMEFTATVLFGLAFAFSLYWVWRLGYLETRQSSLRALGELLPHPVLRAPLNWNRIWHQLLLLVGDVIAFTAALLLTIWFKFYSGWIQPPSVRPLADFIEAPVLLLLCLGWVVLFWLNGLYSMPWDMSRFDKVVRTSRVILFGVLLLGIVTTDPARPFNRSQISTLFFYAGALIFWVNAIRLLIIGLEKRFRALEYSPKNTLIVGANAQTKQLLEDIHGNPHLLYQIVGVLEKKGRGREFGGYPLWTGFHRLPQLVQEKQIEEVLIVANGTEREDLLALMAMCDRLGVAVKTMPDEQELAARRNPDLAGHALQRLFPEPMLPWQWGLKRTIDFSVSLFLLLCALPLGLMLLILLRWKYDRSPLVGLPVLGKHGQPFNLPLFRLGPEDQLTRQAYQQGLRADQVDGLGRFLYRSYLYKLPVLWSVLIGDMSLVGPRPESPEWYRQQGESLVFIHRRLAVRPGLTGLAQVKYRFDRSQKNVRERVKYDLYYAENLSLRMDLRILLRSLLLLISRGNQTRTS